MMAASRHSHEDWWKDVPCHFNWNLEESCTVDYKTIVNNLESKLETRDEIGWKDPICDVLLFRGYLEVSCFKGAIANPSKAFEFFRQAEEEARKIDDFQARRACFTVLSANRLWVLEKFKDAEEGDTATKDKRNTVLETLRSNWVGSIGQPEDELFAYIYAIEGFALARIGLTKLNDALTRYKTAIQIVLKNASWYHTCGLLIGRLGRQKLTHATACYEEMNEEIRYYEKAIELDPTNGAARCDLANVLVRIPERKEDAYELIDKTEDKSCQVIIEKGRFYRRQHKFQEALVVLQKGERHLKKPRADLFLQIALVYKDRAKKSFNADEKSYRDKITAYIEKCLEREPSNFGALLEKAWAHHNLGEYVNAGDIYLQLIEQYKSSPRDRVHAQDRYIKHLYFYNGNIVTEEMVLICEEIVDTCVEILKETDHSGNKKFTGKKGILTKATINLKMYYSRISGGDSKMKLIQVKLVNVGIRD